MKILLVCYLRAWLLCAAVGALADDDNNIFLSPDSGLTSFGDGTDLLAGIDASSPEYENSASSMFSLGDSNAFLPFNEVGSDLFDSDLGDIGSPNDITSSNEEFNLDDGFISGLIANSDADCVFNEGQPIGRMRRRENTCRDPTLFKDPSTDVQKPPANPGGVFPPPGSNPGRLSGPRNDPKPRPEGAFAAANSEFDFEFCPSGTDGYRKYAVCDSGIAGDRFHLGFGIFSLFHCTRSKYIA